MKHVLSIWTACVFLFASSFAAAQQSRNQATASAAGAQATGQASVPRLIKFSGALHDISGKPMSGPVDVTFSLYSEEAGGNALWFETQTVQADSRGNYTVLLGAMTAAGVPIELFTEGQAHWLGVQVANLPELARILLVSVPYAMKAGDAETLGGKPASAYLLSSQTGSVAAAGGDSALSGLISTGTKRTTAGSEAPVPQATGSTPVTTAGGTLGFLPTWDSPSDITDSSLFQDTNTGFLGLGTTTPGGQLHVQSGSYLPNQVIVDNGQTSTLPTLPNNFTSSLTIRAAQTSGSRPFWAGYDNNGSWAGFVGFGACAGDYGTICLDQGAGTTVNTVFKASGSALTFGGGIGTSGNFSTISLAPVSGNVGIGTTNPAAKLEVNGTAMFDQPVTFAAGQTFTSASGQLISTATTGTAPIQVTSTTQVANLNASLLGGFGAVAFAQVGAPNSFIGNQSVAGNLFVGSGAPLSLPFEVRTGSTEALTVTSTGKVGIGTSSPAFGLDLNSQVFAIGPKSASPGSGGTMRFRDDSGTIRWLFGMPGSVGTTDFFMYNNVSGQAPLYIEGNAPSYGLYMKANGNVGIGTSNPGAKLEVNGSAMFDLPVTFAAGQTFTSATGQLVSTATTGTAPFQVASTTQVANLNASLLGGLGSGAYAQIAAPNNFLSNQNIAGNLFVGTGTPSNIPMEVRVGPVSALTVGTTGKIGIATSSPVYGLDINRNDVAIGPSVPGQGAGGTIRFRDDSGTVRWLFGLPGNAGATDFFMYNNVTGAAPLYIKAGATSYRLYVDSTGNVGIGTSTPSATLEVNGSAKFDGTVNFAGAQTFTGTISATGQIVSTVSTGTAPLSVTSTTQVANLNASLLGGMPASAFATVGPNTFTGTQTIAGGSLALPSTASSSIGVLSIGGSPFAHSYGASSNTFLGRSAGNFSMTGAFNTGTGSLALISDTTGGSNTANGWSALVSNTIGSSNTASGYAALYSNNAGANNTAAGASALFNNTDGGGNTAMGFSALLNNCVGMLTGCTAAFNTAVGYNAGVTSTASNANKTGAGDTFVGANSGPASATQLNNATAVGANAVVGSNNSLVLGSISGVNGAAANVNVGIGTATPSAALHVADGDVYASQAGTGIIVKSPDGTKCARIGIDNTGVIVATPITCP